MHAFGILHDHAATLVGCHIVVDCSLQLELVCLLQWLAAMTARSLALSQTSALGILQWQPAPTTGEE